MFLSLGTLIGIILGFGLFLLAVIMNTDNYFMFLNVSSLFMVLGGTLAATMIAYQGCYVIKALSALFSILLPFQIKPMTLFAEVEKIIYLAKILKKEGVLGLEKEITSDASNDDFMHMGATLITSGYTSDDIRQMMSDATETNFERNMVSANILQTMANFSPAFGMIGTLVGLVIMLEKMGADITQIGPGLALALITTLYGILLAHLIFKPAAEKMQQRHEIIRFRNYLIVEGFVLLSEGKDSISIQDKLNSYLDPKNRFGKEFVEG